MDRRDFLISGTLGLVGAVAGCTKASTGADSPIGSVDSPRGDSQPATCTATASDIEGPYYLEDVPVRSKLDLYGDEGSPLLLSGVVVDESCQPIVGAIVELWHADPDGAYDTTSPEKRYYGQVATEPDGSYGFTTLMPGHYLNGSEYRPAHLHMKVWVDGVERLTTQIYFEGDPYNATDGWYDPAREIAPDAEGAATFDVTVSRG